MKTAGRVIFWGGAILPSLTLFLLLAAALWIMPGLRPFAKPEEGQLKIEVTGRQFWWEVIYRLPNGAAIVSANEVRLPVGQRVELILKSADVIHSFWIPSLAGKMDMIPGRTNRLSLLATTSGILRGACAEFCGTSHAKMSFIAVTMDAGEFERWLAAEARPSPAIHAPGAEAFQRHGCGACHRIAGSDAQGLIGPDLSHVGSRLTVAAGTLPNTREALGQFIAAPHVSKPGQQMPAFDMLPAEDLASIAAYLKGLE